MERKIQYHFSDCPYNCNSKGKIVDPREHKWVDCPYCYDKRMQLAKEGVVEVDNGVEMEISEALGIKNARFLSGRFVYRACIPEFETGEDSCFEPETVELQEKEAKRLYEGLCAGELPEGSMLFGLGGSGRVDMFLFPMLVHAYKAGLTVAWVESLSYDRMKSDRDYDVERLVDSDLLMVVLLDGDTLQQVLSVKGLMKMRALRYKPTVLVTTGSPLVYRKLLHGYNDPDLYELAKPVFLIVKSRWGKSRNYGGYMNGILGLKNTGLSSEAGTEVLHMDSDDDDAVYGDVEVPKSSRELSSSGGGGILFSEI